MKCLRRSFCLVVCVLLTACGQVTSTPLPTETSIPNVVPSQSTTNTPDSPILEPSPVQDWNPTPLPTIEPTKIADLLKEAFSVQDVDTINGHTLRRVTGWSYGYEDDGGKAKPYYTNRYQWMDSNHLLLFPKIGVERHPNWDTVLTHAVVINLNTGKVWLPPEQPKEENRVLNILLPRWSPKAEVLISSERVTEGDATKEGVNTYTPEGKVVRNYEGKLIDVSPSGNKMLIGNSWIDLSSGRVVDFAWHFGPETQRWLPAWSSDETRIYMCCYFFGDAATGESYSLTDHDNIFEGKVIDQNLGGFQSLHHSHGRWLNDTYVLAEADGFYTYMTGFESMVPIFDPSMKTYRDLRKLANLPNESDSTYQGPPTIDVSPKGDYLWLHQPAYPNGFLIDLKTFQSWSYPGSIVQWSGNGNYVFIDLQLLDLSTKEFKTLPANVNYCSFHPTKDICMYIATSAENEQTLTLLNIKNMTIQEVSLPAQVSFAGASWSPVGDRIALTAEDNSLWQVDYPTLASLKQIMQSQADLRIQSLIWSADGEYLSFVDGADIYIVDTNDNP